MHPGLHGTWEIIRSDIPDYFTRSKEYHHFGTDGFMRLVIPEGRTKIHVFRYQITSNTILFTDRGHRPLWTCGFELSDGTLTLITEESLRSELKPVDPDRVTGTLAKLVSYEL